VVPTAGGGEAVFVEGAVNSSEVPERDLSVQLSGWMLMEAAHVVEAAATPQEPDAVAHDDEPDTGSSAIDE